MKIIKTAFSLLMGVFMSATILLASSSWSEHVRGYGSGSSQWMAESQARNDCDRQANYAESRCFNDRGSPMTIGCNPFCNGSGSYWSCSADGTVNCTIIDDPTF
jgi:hypothetical protein